MAPEIYYEKEYGAQVDIYSLGLVLYWLLNHNRGPFLPAYPEPITYASREQALRRRVSGEVMSPPEEAEPQLAKVILKACAFAPQDRYADAKALREELEILREGGIKRDTEDWIADDRIETARAR